MSADHGEPPDSSEQCSLFNVTVLQKNHRWQSKEKQGRRHPPHRYTSHQATKREKGGWGGGVGIRESQVKGNTKR